MQTLAIIGNPNSGKTTLFNRLTGSNQHVGNWPGVTIDRKTGHIEHAGKRVDAVDLPGIYSLSPYTQEEIIAREFVLSDELDGILNIVDATNLERNLYLTMQLIGLGLPMIIALNFIDDVEAQDIHIDCEKMSAHLGVPVLPISARRGIGISSLLDAVTGDLQPPTHQPAYLHGVGAAIRHGAEILETSDLRACSRPFYAAKLLEDDPQIVSHIQLTTEQRAQMDALADALCAHDIGQDHEMLFADAFYDYIEGVVRESVTRPSIPKQTPTTRIDRIVMQKWLALPIFIAIMALMFWTTFGPIGETLKGALESLLQEGIAPNLETLLLTLGTSDWIISLICDGIIGGVGGVVSFLPQIIILFFFLSMLEDTGYLARIAFIMDTLLRRIGLSGKSFVPMLMGFGCTTPAVMAARTMENEKDRRMTIMLTPFMSCGAKLPSLRISGWCHIRQACESCRHQPVPTGHLDVHLRRSTAPKDCFQRCILWFCLGASPLSSAYMEGYHAQHVRQGKGLPHQSRYDHLPHVYPYLAFTKLHTHLVGCSLSRVLYFRYIRSYDCADFCTAGIWNMAGICCPAHRPDCQRNRCIHHECALRSIYQCTAERNPFQCLFTGSSICLSGVYPALYALHLGFCNH